MEFFSTRSALDDMGQGAGTRVCDRCGAFLEKLELKTCAGCAELIAARKRRLGPARLTALLLGLLTLSKYAVWWLRDDWAGREAWQLYVLSPLLIGAAPWLAGLFAAWRWRPARGERRSPSQALAFLIVLGLFWVLFPDWLMSAPPVLTLAFLIMAPAAGIAHAAALAAEGLNLDQSLAATRRLAFALLLGGLPWWTTRLLTEGAPTDPRILLAFILLPLAYAALTTALVELCLVATAPEGRKRQALGLRALTRRKRRVPPQPPPAEPPPEPPSEEQA